MGRIIEQQTNIWGAQGSKAEPQRSDLWVVDFSQAISGMNQQIREEQYALAPLDPTLEPYYAHSVHLPPLGVRPEEVRRDSRPYKMPGFDECLGDIRIGFILDSGVAATSSKVYKLLDTWRAFTRAGTGSLGNEDAIQQLNKNYRVDYAFDISLTLLRGNSNPTLSSDPNDEAGVLPDTTGDEVSNDLEQSGVILIENAWLGSFKVSELEYHRTEVVKIEAVFFAENILNEPIAS